MDHYDILIKHARLRHFPDELMDISISGGKINTLSGTIVGQAQTEIDARGMLVTESFVNPHIHLCKVYTAQMLDEQALKDYHGAGMGKAMSAIELATRVKDTYAEAWIIKNVRKAVAQAALYGCTHLRAFADVDPKARLEGIKALIKARQEFKGIVEIQVVAFAQDGLLREPGAQELMVQAMELGADVAGGIPWIEYTEADMARHIEIIFNLAIKYDKDVSMLVDDAGDPGLRTLERMAQETIQRGWQGRALAHHARAYGAISHPLLAKNLSVVEARRHGRGFRSTHRAAPRPCPRDAGRGQPGLPGPGRHLRRLLPVWA